jgi:hypothetical protein
LGGREEQAAEDLELPCEELHVLMHPSKKKKKKKGSVALSDFISNFLSPISQIKPEPTCIYSPPVIEM